MASLPIRWILARTYCQATEEESRVVQALDTAVSGGTLTRQSVEGQHGNRVIILTRRLESAGDLRKAWGRWSETGLLGALREDGESRVDDDAILHIRLGKTKA